MGMRNNMTENKISKNISKNFGDKKYRRIFAVYYNTNTLSK